MLNVVAALMFIFGLIGLFALVLRYLQASGKLTGSGIFNVTSKHSGTLIESPIAVDAKRQILNITHRGQRYVILTGPNNDILLETTSALRSIENLELERQHV